jgi:hypothetical protein
MAFDDELLGRARDYAQRNSLVLGERLGFGIHGIVFEAKRQPEAAKRNGRSAVKVHRFADGYHRERDVYLRLRELGVSSIRGCHVPQLLQHDDELLVIEMSMVSRPFLLDFGAAYLDTPLDFSEEVMTDWREQKREEFGPRWPEVQAILAALEMYGIFMEDVNPGNISFGD